MKKKTCQIIVFFQLFLRSIYLQEVLLLMHLHHLFLSVVRKISSPQDLAVRSKLWTKAEMHSSQRFRSLERTLGKHILLTYSKTLSTATWDPQFKRAFVHVQRGQSCVHVGLSERRRLENGQSRTFLELFPEEAVYLIERGALDCRWTQTPGCIPSPDSFSTCIPISVSQAYSHLLGTDSSNLARYQVCFKWGSLQDLCLSQTSWIHCTTCIGGRSSSCVYISFSGTQTHFNADLIRLA